MLEHKQFNTWEVKPLLTAAVRVADEQCKRVDAVINPTWCRIRKALTTVALEVDKLYSSEEFGTPTLITPSMPLHTRIVKALAPVSNVPDVRSEVPVLLDSVESPGAAWKNYALYGGVGLSLFALGWWWMRKR